MSSFKSKGTAALLAAATALTAPAAIAQQQNPFFAIAGEYPFKAKTETKVLSGIIPCPDFGPAATLTINPYPNRYSYFPDSTVYVDLPGLSTNNPAHGPYGNHIAWADPNTLRFDMVNYRYSHPVTIQFQGTRILITMVDIYDSGISRVPGQCETTYSWGGEVPKTTAGTGPAAAGYGTTPTFPGYAIRTNAPATPEYR
jgi:hypothetical protein